MDVILKVLEGAKVGTKVAIKKDEFSIGRSPKCHLCAGSSSISRRHCVLVRHETTVSIKDLGSSNGTLINGKIIAPNQEVELSTGDEITVGTLSFLVTITHGIRNLKRSQVKSVAEAVDRTAETESGHIVDDDISNWLVDGPSATGHDFAETQTIRMDDTNAAGLTEANEKSASDQEEAKVREKMDGAAAVPGETGEGAAIAKRKKKKEPGKLPPIPEEPSSKDSREAAMQALRNWNRRR